LPRPISASCSRPTNGRSTCEYDTNTSDNEHPYPDARRPTSPDGRTPLRLGVTGHRSLDQEAAVRSAINLAIDQALREHGGGTSQAADLIVVSALAEGADRLVVDECLRRDGTTLEAILPLPMDEYAKDFETVGSRQQFAHLLGQAASVEIAETMPSREEAYERAGHLMVERSDVVLAVWDGLPARGRGGTADIVAYALARDVPVVRIDSEADHR
jgi:hypothetical protein